MLTEVLRDSFKHPTSIILGSAVTVGFICCTESEKIKKNHDNSKQILCEPTTSLIPGLADIGVIVAMDKTLPCIEFLFRLALGRLQ